MGTSVATGDVIGGFRVEQLVGRGAMATVYRAVAGDSVVALKILDDSLAEDDRFRQRFLRESRIAAHLDSPHVVPTLRSGEDGGRLYLAMEYVAGSDLRDRLRREGRLEPARAVAVVEQVADGLDAAHAAGLVHRDVKPGNILLRGDRAYVCDFGLARHTSTPSSLTGDRGFVGTIDYVPPEQIEGAAIGPAADVYSLGCVLYECLTGTRPFERESELAVVFAHLNEPPPRVTAARPDVPSAFDDVVATALAKAPDDRYGSCGELARAARAALHGRVLARRRSRRRLVAASLAALGVAGGATAAAVLLTRPSVHTTVTITPTAIRGARLGDSDVLLQKLWGGGQKLIAQTPGNYNILTERSRNVSAYFRGGDDRAVEITTWNANDRTAEGVGPCSTVADLKRAYGSRLKPSPHNTYDGVVGGWTVGKHLFFGTAAPKNPSLVISVAVYSGSDLGAASFIALNEGPCGPAAVNAPVSRPAVTAAPELPSTLASGRFRLRVAVRTPSSWRVAADSPAAFDLTSPAGGTLRFRLDPVAATASGEPLRSVGTTAAKLAQWLERESRFTVEGESTSFVGRQSFTATELNLSARSRSTPYFAFVGGAPLAAGSRSTRVYLVPLRIGTLVHTLAVTGTGVSPAAADAILRTIRVAAEPGPSLSALSGFCVAVYFGTCRGELDAGTYRSQTFTPALTYTVPVGWTNFTDHEGVFGFTPPGGDFTVVDDGLSDVVDVVTSVATPADQCNGGPGRIHTPQAFVDWIRQQPALDATEPRAAAVGGLAGYVLDIRLRKSWTKKCPGSPIAGFTVLAGRPPAPGGFAHGIGAGPGVMRLYLLGYGGGTLAIEVDDVRGDSRLESYSKVVQTFRFAGR